MTSVNGTYLLDDKRSAQFMARHNEGVWHVSVSVAGLARLDATTANLTPWTSIDNLIVKCLDQAGEALGATRRYPGMRMSRRMRPTEPISADKVEKPDKRRRLSKPHVEIPEDRLQEMNNAQDT